MQEYEFELKYAVPAGLTLEMIEHRLFEGGCDDALPGVGQKGRLALAFHRNASSAQRAVNSALRDVGHALPELRLVEVGPDWVGVSEVAGLFEFSRQYMLKLINQNQETFPLPLHEGKAALWHLAEVLGWFVEYQGRTVDASLCDVAAFTRVFNIAREFRGLNDAQRRQAVRLAEAG